MYFVRDILEILEDSPTSHAQVLVGILTSAHAINMRQEQTSQTKERSKLIGVKREEMTRTYLIREVFWVR